MLPLALAASLAAAGLVALGSVWLPTLGLYLIGLALALRWALGGWRPSWRLERSDAALLGALLAAQAGLLGYAATGFPTHFHHDEFETAYASLSLPALGQIDWFGGYPRAGLWVARFPIPFFAFQAPVLGLFGPSLLSIRASVWPYLALTAVYLYLLARDVNGSRISAGSAVFLWIVFAPGVYINSLGVHFGSSALALVAALYHSAAILRSRGPSPGHAVGLGLSAAGAYLTYTASYLALPLVVILIVGEMAVAGARPHRRSLAAAGLIFVLTLLPFAVYAVASHNYFLERSGQIGVVGIPGVARANLAADADARPRGELLREQVSLNLRALTEDGQGGATGYHFGGQALFGRVGLGLALLGIGASGALAHSRRSLLPLVPVGVCLASFLAGMVLTVPAGAFHRASVGFPFVGLLMAVGLAAVAGLAGVLGRRFAGSTRSSASWPSVAVSVAGLTLVAATELPRAVRMLVDDQSHPSPRIASELSARVRPGGAIAIVGPANYHLPREIALRTGGVYRVDFIAWPGLPDHPYDAIVLMRPDGAAMRRALELVGTPARVVTFDGKGLNDHALVVQEVA